MRQHSGVVLPALLALLLAGCRLDMHIQPKLTPLRPSDFFADGRGSRPLVPGTVARGELRYDSYFYTGMVGKDPGTEMPFPVTREVLDRGQERFNIYCSPCHSRVGDGNGIIVQRGYRRPPSYYDPKLLNAPIGHFYDVMTNGFGAMPDYSAQVTPRDRWAIAAYIRALQLSQHAPTSAVPPGTSMSASAGDGAGAGATSGGEGKQP
jgi:cbb3-type cytochrome c oxidase subunit III